jgi:AraC-like DNA-binding protein
MMDALSDVLKAVRLSGAVFFDVRASDPWVAEAPAGSAIVRGIFPDADHLISYHVITRGECWGGLTGEPPLRLAAGDVFVIPHGEPHVLSSTPGMRDRPLLSRYRRPADRQLPFAITLGRGASDDVEIVCGFLGCDARPFNPLLAALPRVMHVAAEERGALGLFVQSAVAESRTPRIGGECVLDRLSELMFVDVVRRHLEKLPADRTGWLAGLRDPVVGRALEALHQNPARDWTIESLARESGASRSVLAERFASLVGVAPMQYLAGWRMQLAASHLRNGTDGIALVAARVGYESEAAFSRAFKRAVGDAPGEWRRKRAVPGRPSPQSRASGGHSAH